MKSCAARLLAAVELQGDLHSSDKQRQDLTCRYRTNPPTGQAAQALDQLRSLHSLEDTKTLVQSGGSAGPAAVYVGAGEALSGLSESEPVRF